MDSSDKAVGGWSQIEMQDGKLGLKLFSKPVGKSSKSSLL